jgi:Uma2 family endonuclease
MYAVVSPERIQIPVGSVMQIPGSWEDYCALRDSRGDGSIPRIKYRQGEILLMSPLPRHGREANLLADIVKAILVHQEQEYEAFTPITIDIPKTSGIEPDYCFYIENWQSSIGKDRINWQVDPPPDLAIEIDVTSFTSELDFLPYRVPELWILKKNKLNIYLLAADHYELSENSRIFPELALQEIIDQCFTTAKDQGSIAVLQQLREFLQKQS